MNTILIQKLALPSLFASGMVLQRNKPIPVWGRGPDGMLVCVQFDSEKVVAKVADQQWMVTLTSLPAGGPHVMIITCGEEQCTFQNILVGEVFLCSGQSNVQWPVAGMSNKEEIVSQADNGELRLFLQDDQAGPSPYWDCLNGRWATSTRDNAPDHPSLPLLFGLRLQERLGVPVGILVAAVGGSGITSWLPKATFERHDDLCNYWDHYSWSVENYDTLVSRWEGERCAHQERNRRLLESGKAAIDFTKYLFWGPRGPRNLAQPAGLFHGMIHPIAPFAISGVIWYQGETDAEAPEYYQRNLRELIDGWRSLWGMEPLTFFVIQIVGCSAVDAAVNWPFIREAQMLVANTVEKVILVPAADLGDPKDIHPNDKELLAERMGRFVEPYLRGGFLPEAPRIVNVEFAKDKSVRLLFSRAVRMASSKISGFEIAGSDGEFRAAVVTLLTPRTAIVETCGDDAPTALRYLWQGAPDPCLFSEDGLLLLPHRTDTSTPQFKTDEHYCSEW